MSSTTPTFKYFKVQWPAQYVVHVEINRADKLNAFFHAMFLELKEVFDYLSPHPDVRAIILSGAGDRAFTAGLDVQQESDGELKNTNFPDSARRANRLRHHIKSVQDGVTAVANCEKPVICLIHGYAYGLGIDLSTACDIRLCSPDAKLCVKEVDIGIAADVGTLSRLPKVMGMTSFAKEICLTARPFGAEEALQNNFVSRIVPGGKKELVDAGLEMAKLLASKSPVAVLGTKNILDAAWGRTVEDNLNYTAVWNSAMLQSQDVEKAMLSGLKKRTPTFEKL